MSDIQRYEGTDEEGFPANHYSAGTHVVLAADYDRDIAALREENRRLHDSIAMLESLPGNELVRESRERAEAAERERDDLLQHADRLAEILADIKSDWPHMSSGTRLQVDQRLAAYRDAYPVPDTTT